MCEDDSEGSNEQQNFEIAVDGTVSKKTETSSPPDSPSLHSIFKKVSDPTGQAKRNIMMDKASPTFFLLFDKYIYYGIDNKIYENRSTKNSRKRREFTAR
ncbi:hypothetical protein NPIL_425321 [Nephila pilipes]|uniref:Uncharacterized protein n=1 Tax=Nephila pilipes TaxID=299642 RepID=A0A8X6QBZ4_NEPPI|nr:hypothetical protein NPIL_425321 [Nephila pilipes]